MFSSTGNGIGGTGYAGLDNKRSRGPVVPDGYWLDVTPFYVGCRRTIVLLRLAVPASPTVA